jgi:hypothetical protein
MAKVTEVVKEIAQTWQKLAKEDRQKYKEAAKRGKNLNLFEYVFPDFLLIPNYNYFNIPN